MIIIIFNKIYVHMFTRLDYKIEENEAIVKKRVKTGKEEDKKWKMYSCAIMTTIVLIISGW